MTEMVDARHSQISLTIDAEAYAAQMRKVNKSDSYAIYLHNRLMQPMEYSVSVDDMCTGLCSYPKQVIWRYCPVRVLNDGQVEFYEEDMRGSYMGKYMTQGICSAHIKYAEWFIANDWYVEQAMGEYMGRQGIGI
jgi:hypothetical protein